MEEGREGGGKERGMRKRERVCEGGGGGVVGEG